jgi:hypothetical protein
MERRQRIQMIALFLCIPLLALGDAAAWARHYRVVAEPCPARCKVRKLSLCSACMGGTMTCAQNLMCSTNRAVVCGEESTVTVPCWNRRYRW